MQRLHFSRFPGGKTTKANPPLDDSEDAQGRSTGHPASEEGTPAKAEPRVSVCLADMGWGGWGGWRQPSCGVRKQKEGQSHLARRETPGNTHTGRNPGAGPATAGRWVRVESRRCSCRGKEIRLPQTAPPQRGIMLEPRRPKCQGQGSQTLQRHRGRQKGK